MSELASIEQAEQVRQLELLLDLSRQVAAHDSLEDVLEALVAAAIRETRSRPAHCFCTTMASASCTPRGRPIRGRTRFESWTTVALSASSIRAG